MLNQPREGNMNFFRKKNAAFITLEQPDFFSQAPKLWKDLLYTVEAGGITRVILRIYEESGLPLNTISVVVSLGLKLQASAVQMELQAPPRIVHTLKKMNLSPAFSQVTEIN